MDGSAWPRRAATTWTGTPGRGSVVAWMCGRSWSRAFGSGSLGFGPVFGALWRRIIVAASELANAIFEYLEIFHNRQRRHSSLGMLTPMVFKKTTTVA